MVFIEAILFARRLPDYLEDDEYSKLQNFLIKQPDAGDLIQDTGGLRKLRCSLDNKGKRSGVRVIYYWQTADDQIYFFTLFVKNETSDLSANDKKALKLMLEDW